MIAFGLTILSLFILPGIATEAPSVVALAMAPASDTVYVFLSPSCPVCKATTSGLRELQTTNPTVAFVGVVDTASADSAEVAEFYRDYKLKMSVRWDSDSLAARFKATTTPEVVVLHNGRRVYQGRVNNQYESLGKRRRVVTQHELRDVLSTLAIGAVPSFRRTIPIGCFLEK